MKLAAGVFVWMLFVGCARGQLTSLDPKHNNTTEALNGEFVGMEEIKDYEPGEKWFHENSLIVQAGEAVLDKVPVVIVKNKKLYSASDGGFITYRGRFFRQDDQLLISLRPFESDYILFLTAKRDACDPYSKVKIAVVAITPQGLLIDGILYRNKVLLRKKREQLLQWLHSEPTEYTGQHPYRPDLNLPPCQH